METSSPDRRRFLSSSTSLLGGGWLALHLPALAAISACAREAEVEGRPFVTLTAAEGRALEAVAARILPSEGEFPGAVEAGAVRFIDVALSRSPFSGARALLKEGLADLDRRAGEAGANDFAALPAERQDDLLREVESTPFFGPTHTLVVAGTFTDPARGGNRDGVGWALLGFEHRPAYQPPFGHYDAAAAAERGDA